MANNSEKYIQGVALQSGTGIGPVSNTPTQYGNRQHQYLAHRTEQYIKARAKYSSDFVQANVQGLFKDDFYRYASTFIRLADIAAQSANGSKNVDDVKVILFSEPSIDYFPIGAKIQTMGSTWICTNPSNISSVHSTAVVQRCNAAYSLYDYYGNIVTEPIIIEKTAMSSNDNGTPQNLVMMEGYFTVICQLNEYTRQLGQNQRIILGSKAYFITGFTDFIQEFTGDYDSVHLLRFSIRIEEPTDNDDLVNHIANGKNYSFGASISGADEIATGESAQLTAHFIKNGEEMSATEEYPLTWQWSTSDTAVVTVAADGTVTAIGEGNAQITATLEQAQGVKAVFNMKTYQRNPEPFVNFIGVIPESIEQFDNALIEAGYYVDGQLTDNVIEWSFNGARSDSYFTTINDNTVLVSCLRADSEPLIVTASYGDKHTSIAISLEGY